jgi:hypothetical protein
MRVGDNGSTLQVINGGIRLPVNLANLNVNE